MKKPKMAVGGKVRIMISGGNWETILHYQIRQSLFKLELTITKYFMQELHLPQTLTSSFETVYVFP